MSILDLRAELDDIIGAAKRADLFECYLKTSRKQFCVQQTASLAEAEHTAQRLRYLGLHAEVIQAIEYPQFHGVWVRL